MLYAHEGGAAAMNLALDHKSSICSTVVNSHGRERTNTSID